MTTSDDGERPRYVVHLTVRVADLAAAHLLARTVSRSLAFLPELVLGETTLSEEGLPGVQHQVFCDRLVGNGRRCVLRPEHHGDCARRLLR
ncbi:hypothetical protein [Micromonospora sp. SH-82]|uniref:hypothetical protein n=1 Tax=Micromonospora sp. SH-82 TaxID=3132938 RepID=UPI003EBD6AD8